MPSKRYVFNDKVWRLFGGDIGDNSIFFQLAEVFNVRRCEYRGERVADVKWCDTGKVSRGHFVGMMRKNLTI